MEDGAGKTGGDYVRAVIWGRRGGGSTVETLVLNLECVEMLDVPLSLSLCVRLVSWILYFLDFMIYPHLAI